MSTSYVSSSAARVSRLVPDEEVQGYSVRLSWSLVVAGLVFIFGGAAALMALLFAAAATIGTAGEILSGACAFGSIIAGAILLFISGTQACARCREPMLTRTVMLAEDAHEPLLECLEAGDEALLSFLGGSSDAEQGTRQRVGLEFEACPSCRQSGWVTPVKLRWNEARSRFDAFECGEPVHKAARTIVALERIAKARAASH
ncbi:MAG: hypothetical protein L6Q84_31090 [Polyangiaceae bacterium]|nr:hypothetical protein [Polyangiaceae bacterium]